ncbi:hypothetical protein [Cohnella caldifontis]|uniref:hypothetical protein n=1 Tax=Cohnella caldifontis TaxID=3027471 RepID=UPI0023EB29B3|nr:hypothetical protein [Cohnella sp. YIM B05605]
MTELTLRVYRDIGSEALRGDFRAAMEAKGYYAFFGFIEDLRATLKRYEEEEKDEVGKLLGQCRTDFPNLSRYSPSWERLWDELTSIYEAKNEALAEVPLSERDGEWQVLIDNPYTPQQVVCYPGLGFADAAYLYAYFQQDLKPNEYLRLQKVTNVAIKTGSKEVSMFPRD